MTELMSIGLLGLGGWGKNILRNLHELGALHTACDIDEDLLEERRREFPSVFFSSSIDELINNPEITAVAIATPAATHYEIAKQALSAGKDVFVEKPLSLRLKEGIRLMELAQREGRILMVGHVLQYHPAVIKLREIISKGELGRLQYIYSNRLSIGRLRTEENILWSFAPHDISVILSLFGELPTKVTAVGGDYVNRGVYDTSMSLLEFRNGVQGHIFVNWLHPFKEQKLVVVGSKAMAVFDDLTENKLVLYPHNIEWRDGKTPIAQKAEFIPVAIEKLEPLKAELQHFIECIGMRTKPRTDGYEGVRVLKVLQALQESLASRTPVELTEVVNVSTNSKPAYV